MNIIIIILAIVAFFLLVLFYFNKKSFSGKTFSLKVDEFVTVSGLAIKNTGGGHKINIDGSDTSFSNINLSSQEREETIIMLASDDGRSKLWNGYLLTAVKIGWDGEIVELEVKKVGEPKIAKSQASDMARAYLKDELNNLSQEMGQQFGISTSDRGGKYFIEINDSDKQIYFLIDKFSGDISDVKTKGFTSSKVNLGE